MDAGARACAVCRGWRDALADASLWQHLDFTLGGGVWPSQVTPALVRAAVARAAGQLRVLVLSYVGEEGELELIHEVVQANGAALRELNMGSGALNEEALRRLLAAAPQLQVLIACVDCPASDVPRLLRNEPPFGPLRARGVRIRCAQMSRNDCLQAAAVVAVNAWVKRLDLVGLTLENPKALALDDPTALNALLDAAVTRCVEDLTLYECDLYPRCMPALTRLLQCGSLTAISFDGLRTRPDDLHEVQQLFCVALRGNASLTRLWLRAEPEGVKFPYLDTAMVAALLECPGLISLDLRCHLVGWGAAAAGHALSELVISLQCLHNLRVSGCFLGDDGLAPLLDAVDATWHLLKLECDDNGATEAFERDRLAPALAALAARVAATPSPQQMRQLQGQLEETSPSLRAGLERLQKLLALYTDAARPLPPPAPETIAAAAALSERGRAWVARLMARLPPVHWLKQIVDEAQAFAAQLQETVALLEVTPPPAAPGQARPQ